MLWKTIWLTSFLLIVLFGVTSGQEAGRRNSKEWLQLIAGNAVKRKSTPTSYPGAKPGYALYYIRTDFMQAGEIEAPYIVRVPTSYDPAKPTPAVVFLHGAILARETFQHTDPAIADEPIFAIADTFNSIVIFPFGKSGFMWPNQQAADDNVLAIIADAEQHYNIDKRKLFLGGISMGGIATFWFVNHHPDLFAGFYTFSAMPRLAEGPIQFSNITRERPLYSMNAMDDPGFSYNEVHELYEQHKKEAPGWYFSSVETGGHRFIYGANGKRYVKLLLGNLLKN